MIFSLAVSRINDEDTNSNLGNMITYESAEKYTNNVITLIVLSPVSYQDKFWYHYIGVGAQTLNPNF